jgi:hypothetical protein
VTGFQVSSVHSILLAPIAALSWYLPEDPGPRK